MYFHDIHFCILYANVDQSKLCVPVPTPPGGTTLSVPGKVCWSYLIWTHSMSRQNPLQSYILQGSGVSHPTKWFPLWPVFFVKHASHISQNDRISIYHVWTQVRALSARKCRNFGGSDLRRIFGHFSKFGVRFDADFWLFSVILTYFRPFPSDFGEDTRQGNHTFGSSCYIHFWRTSASCYITFSNISSFGLILLT